MQTDIGLTAGKGQKFFTPAFPHETPPMYSPLNFMRSSALPCNDYEIPGGRRQSATVLLAADQSVCSLGRGMFIPPRPAFISKIIVRKRVMEPACIRSSLLQCGSISLFYRSFFSELLSPIYIFF